MKTNTILKTIAVLFGSAIMLTSCIEETFPEGGSATNEQVADSPFTGDGIVMAMPTILMNNNLGGSSGYGHFDFGYPGIMGMLDRLAGDVFPVSGNVKGGNQYYDRFQFVMYHGSAPMMDDHYGWVAFFYDNYYQFLYPANSAVTIFSAGEPSPELGMAYAFRAHIYMDMARMYDPLPAVASGEVGTVPYEIPEAVKGLTVPLVTENSTLDELEFNERRPRDFMWAYILNDLNRAEELLKDYTPDVKTKPSYAVICGLKARAYLWLGGFTENYGDVALDDNTTVNVPTGEAAYREAAKYARMAINAAGGAVMTEADWTSPTVGFGKVASSWMWALCQSTDTVLGNLHSWTAHMSNESIWGYGALAQPGINKLYYDRMNDTDFRKKIINNPEMDYNKFKDYTVLTKDEYEGKTEDRPFPIAPYANFKFRTNGGEKYDDTKGNVTDIPLMRVEEMMLIEAEATAHYDEGAAKSLLANFMAYRDSAYTYTGSDLVEEIIFQKRVELWGEGLILWDLKRLNYGMITGLEGSNAPNDARYVTNGRAPVWNVPMPLSAVQQNGGLEDKNNPNPSMTYLSKNI